MKTHYEYLLLVFCFILVTGCTTPSQKIQDELKDQSLSDFVAYIDCMKAAANYYAAYTATPHEIADAAQSKCSAKFHTYKRSSEIYLTSSSPPSARAQARRGAQNLAQEVKNGMKEKVVQWVIDNRLQKK